MTLRDTERTELRFTRGEESFEDFPAMAWKPEAIDQQLLESYLDARRRKNGLTLDLPVEEALRTRHLLVETTRGLMLTYAGMLAFARDPLGSLPGARLRLLRFDGITEKFGAERNVTKDRFFEGPIPRIVSSVRDFIRALVHEFDYLGPSGLFVTEPEYPEPAWDEAIVNALVHRSYSLSNATVFVRIFDDRMEIESPGRFPGPARERESRPRNPHLMDALRYFELVRLTREGTRRMAEEMRKLDLPPPEFSEPEGFSVMVVLRNDLERRRKQQGTPNARERWKEIITLLEEPEIAFYRRRGAEDWANLVRSGARPPRDVLASVARVLLNPNIVEEERTRLSDPLLAFVREIPRPELDAWMGALTQGQLHSTPGLESRIASLLRMAPDGHDQFLRWLETCPPASGDSRNIPNRQIDLVLRELHTNLLSGPLPPREHVDRLLAIARRHAAAPEAQRLFEDVTGKPLK